MIKKFCSVCKKLEKVIILVYYLKANNIISTVQTTKIKAVSAVESL